MIVTQMGNSCNSTKNKNLNKKVEHARFVDKYFCGLSPYGIILYVGWWKVLFFSPYGVFFFCGGSCVVEGRSVNVHIISLC